MQRAASGRARQVLRLHDAQTHPAKPARKVPLADLRAQISALETDQAGALRPVKPRLEIASPPSRGFAQDKGDILAVFRAQAGLHDVRPASYLDAPAAYGFALHWMARLPRDRVRVWVRARGDARLDFGAPCPDGLARLGLDPAQFIKVEARPGAQALWAMEEALKAGALVFGEAGSASGYDLTASRRLHRAARESGSQILVLRSHDAQGSSAALTRWSLSPIASEHAPWRGAGGLPGLGAVRVKAVLERQRGGSPDVFDLEWNDDALRRFELAALARRPAQLAIG